MIKMLAHFLGGLTDCFQYDKSEAIHWRLFVERRS